MVGRASGRSEAIERQEIVIPRRDLRAAKRIWRMKNRAAPETVGPAHDWVVLWWSLGCALLGVAAFVIAWTAEPPPAPEEEIWTPPSGAVSVDMSP